MPLKCFLVGAFQVCALALFTMAGAPRPLIAPKGPAPAQDIEGYYICTGREASGKAYAGMTTIAKRGELYLVTWCVGSGSSFTGIGIRQGDVLSVAWCLPTPNGVVRGINVYRVEARRLVGRWASMPGPGAVQNETLEFLRALPPEAEDADD